ncbi:MAG: RluA family pseudouridine synthase [Clostridia bacterium]|nr:RluA family pseudouridine synthase [Clostridia bacterium]
MSSIISYVCQDADEGRMISEILHTPLHLYAGTIRALKNRNGILLNGIPVRVGTKVRAKDRITLDMNKGEILPDIPGEPIPLEILYEDDSLLAVNKPAGMVVHPTVFHQSGTLANALVGYWNEKQIQSGLHFVSRLDVGTSGIILIARNGYVQEHLRRQAEEGTFRKIYHGYVRNDQVSAITRKGHTDTIRLPIARKEGSIMERKVSPDGDTAVTHYEVLAVSAKQPVSKLAFRLETGRTHQIRVHCKYSHFPLVGDTLYGIQNDPTDNLPDLPCNLDHQALHAREVSLIHPITKEELHLTAPYPPEWTVFEALI